MAALEAALARTIAGNAQVVGIVGEPGVGKSRLCFEFLERCRARGLAVFEAHGVPHGKTLPLLPMLELFRSFFGITEQDADQAAREKIAGGMCFSTRACARFSPWSSISWASPIRSIPLQLWTPRAASASSLPWSNG